MTSATSGNLVSAASAAQSVVLDEDAARNEQSNLLMPKRAAASSNESGRHLPGAFQHRCRSHTRKAFTWVQAAKRPFRWGRQVAVPMRAHALFETALPWVLP